MKVQLSFMVQLHFVFALRWLLFITCYLWLAIWIFLSETCYYLQKLVRFARCCTSRIFFLKKWLFCHYFYFVVPLQVKWIDKVVFFLIDKNRKTWVYLLVWGQSDNWFRRNCDFVTDHHGCLPSPHNLHELIRTN